MQTQLERHCNEVLHAQSLKDLLRKMVEFSQERGFARVSATVMTAHSPTLAAHAQAAAFELLLHCDPPAHQLSSPTGEELEALRWTMDGMTGREIGRELDLSQRDVALRLERVVRELGRATKFEAVPRGDQARNDRVRMKQRVTLELEPDKASGSRIGGRG